MCGDNVGALSAPYLTGASVVAGGAVFGLIDFGTNAGTGVIKSVFGLNY